MKKLLYGFAIFTISVLSTAAMAGDHWGHHGWGGYPGGGWGGHHHHHHGGWGGPQVNNYYYGAPRPFYPRPIVNNYYPQPPVTYYAPPPPPPVYYGGGYGGPSHQGLAGGVIGTVFGYELGQGNPLAAGIGAAAGSFLGNGVGWRY